MISLITYILLLLLEWPRFPNGMHVVWQWCLTPCTEATDTLDSVPSLVIDRGFVLAMVFPSQEFPFTCLPSLFSLILLPPPPLPIPKFPPGQDPPVPITAFLLVPPVPFPTSHTYLTVIV